MKVVIVHRYDNPHQFGVHTNDRDENVFDTVGLFSSDDIIEHIRTNYAPFRQSDLPLDKLISCAPIEWHSAMRQGEMLERFFVLTTGYIDKVTQDRDLTPEDQDLLRSLLSKE